MNSWRIDTEVGIAELITLIIIGGTPATIFEGNPWKIVEYIPKRITRGILGKIYGDTMWGIPGENSAGNFRGIPKENCAEIF